MYRQQTVGSIAVLAQKHYMYLLETGYRKTTRAGDEKQAMVWCPTNSSKGGSTVSYIALGDFLRSKKFRDARGRPLVAEVCVCVCVCVCLCVCV